MYKVQSFLFTSGAEVIAKVEDDTAGDSYTVSSPLQVHIMRNQDGSPAIGFAPTSFIRKGGASVKVLKSALMSEPVDVEPEVEKSYLENISGIQLVPAGSQILHG